MGAYCRSMAGPGDIRPFTPHTDPAIIDDLRRRLRTTRWTDAPDDSGWALGTDVSYLRELADYWSTDFDWTAIESEISRFPHLTVTVDGLDIDVIHSPASDSATSFPILLAHGWPDCFWRFLKVIPLLTNPAAHGADPADAFTVVVPDMPGFGYSGQPAGPILDTRDIARMWAQLMSILGYERYGVAGGDMGSHVARYLALAHPDRVAAVHRTDAGLPPLGVDRSRLTPEEIAWADDAARWSATEGAYAAMHSTKPQTAAIGLADSPVGLASWIIEKPRSWSDCAGDLDSVYSRDEVLTLVTQYWVTNTIGSSIRTYRANAATPKEDRTRFVDVPSTRSSVATSCGRPAHGWSARPTPFITPNPPAAVTSHPSRYPTATPRNYVRSSVRSADRDG